MIHNLTNNVFTRIPWVPTRAPIQNSAVDRSSRAYDLVIDQFKVETNPRYAPRDGKTYCNIFAWDVTRAMGAEIPHWTTSEGAIASPATPGARRMNVNAMAQWLSDLGANHGWQRSDQAAALENAQLGRPTIALFANPTDHGHIAVLRPAELTTLAQAGAWRFSRGSLSDSFGSREPDFWIHA